MAIDEIDWSKLNYMKTCLAYLFRGKEILLIRKKTGLGKGKILGPGGKLELGETFKEAMLREIAEEVGLQVLPSNLQERGDLYFYEKGRLAIWNKVFVGQIPLDAKPVESLEAQPFWCSIWNLPFQGMWKNDLYWLPAVLNGSYVQACFLMKGEEICSAYTELSDQALRSLHLRTNLKEA